MIGLKRIKSSEDFLVIYHYLYGELVGSQKDRFLTWTSDEVERSVFNKRDDWKTWDFRVVSNDKLIGVASFTDIDYENLNAKLNITFVDYDTLTQQEIVETFNEVAKFAFYQIGIIRIQGNTIGNKYNKVIKSLGFKQEVIINNAAFKEGVYTSINYFALLKDEYEEMNKYAI